MVDTNSKIIDSYLSLISRLGYDSKLELISRLTASMKTSEATKSKSSISHLFGAFETEETAEELIENIRNARVFNRKIESFD